MNYAIVNNENIVIQLLNYGRVVTDGQTYSAKGLAGLSQAQKDAIKMQDVVTDPQPEYDKETQKLVFIQLKDGDEFASQSWNIVELTDAEHNAVVESKLAQMDSEDMPRACEDIINLLIAENVITQAQIEDKIPYFASKKTAKENERKKIRR